MFAQSPVMVAPITYEVNGEQYIAVLSGWGGAYPLLQGQTSNKSGNERNISRLLVFKLGAKAELPALPPEPKLGGSLALTASARCQRLGRSQARPQLDPTGRGCGGRFDAPQGSPPPHPRISESCKPRAPE